MKIPIIKYCPGTLKKGFDTYSPTFRKKMFDGHSVSHILSFNSEPQQEILLDNRKYMSISGVQIKYSLILEGNTLRLTEKGERGGYILKPGFINREFRIPNMIPANEHLTMQIARQVYDIRTAENGMIFFADGESAYITKRFDIKPLDKSKYLQEDFASILGRTRENHDQEYKYNANYMEIGDAIKQYVGANIPEIDRFYRLVIFNFLFSNGDAHLKNFSLMESPDGDYVLSPAYDLVCSRIHVDDREVALHDGLYEDDTKSFSYSQYGSYCYDTFYEFGKRLGMKDARIKRILEMYCKKQNKVYELIEHSFLDATTKEQYRRLYEGKLIKLSYSVKPPDTNIMTVKLSGFDEKELDDHSGKTLHLEGLSIPGQDCSNFQLQYRWVNGAGIEYKSPIDLFVGPNHPDKSQVILDQYINVPPDSKIYAKLLPVNSVGYKGVALLHYKILGARNI